jgi:beta propeller repeat protein
MNLHKYSMNLGRRGLTLCVGAILWNWPIDVQAQAVIAGSLRQLTTNPAPQLDPSMSGAIVVYTDQRNGNDDVYFMNLSTGVETRVTTSTAPQRLHDVSGGLIVYTDITAPAGTARIHTYEIATGVDTAISSGSDQNARIDGQIVVFERGTTADPNVIAVDLRTNSETVVAGTTAMELNPAVSGTRVVYERHAAAGAPGEIVLFDLVTHVETVLAGTAANARPDIDGNIVVWDVVTADGTTDIAIHDLSTGQTQVLSLPGNQRLSHVSGRFVSFDDDSAGNPDVTIYDRQSGARLRVGGPAAEFLNNLEGNRLVFTSTASGNLDVWLFEFQVTGDTLYGVNSHDDGLSVIDVGTGQVRFLGPLSTDPNRFVTPVAMSARPSDRKLFAWNNGSINSGTGVATGELLTVSACSALATPVDAGTPAQGTLQELAFAPDGTLFGLETELWRIDPATGIRTQVGPGFGARIGGADFTLDGTLYGVELVCSGTAACPTQQRLFRIDTNTGVATFVATLSEDIGTIGAIVFNPGTGTFLGSSFKAVANGQILFDLDITNGAVSNVRHLVSAVAPNTLVAAPQGLGFAPPCVAAQATETLSFFDASVASGNLVGVGQGNSGNGRLMALRKMIKAARDLLLQGQTALACSQLKDVLDRSDGNPQPPDFVSGPAAAELTTLVTSLRKSLGCT